MFVVWSLVLMRKFFTEQIITLTQPKPLNLCFSSSYEKNNKKTMTKHAMFINFLTFIQKATLKAFQTKPFKQNFNEKLNNWEGI